jgi:type I restriction enzyme S subunit
MILNEHKWEEIQNNWTLLGELRLDASYYNDASKGHLLLEKFSGKKLTISDFRKKTFYPGRLKRIWIDKKYGKKFFTGAQILGLYPKTEKFIAIGKMSKPETFKIKDNQLLITRSGTIGNITLPNSKLISQLVTEDVIRIEIDDKADRAYIYAYFNTITGKSMIQQPVFGAVIDHVEPNHIDDIKVPILEKNIKTKISNLILESFRLRNEAISLVDESIKDLHKLLKLPKIDLSNCKYLNQNMNSKTWEINSWSSRLRLDSSFYDISSNYIHKLLKENCQEIDLLGKKNKIYELPTYKRIYLDKTFGVPFLSGKNLMQNNFNDIKYLATNIIKNHEKYLIYEDMILVTMRGTCGNTRLVDKSLNGYGASHNILRIKNSEEYNPGFIFAYLNSDYGKIQMKNKILGSVVDVLTPEDLSEIFIPKVKINIQDKIGNLTKKSFSLFAKANSLENEATNVFEKNLKL